MFLSEKNSGLILTLIAVIGMGIANARIVTLVDDINARRQTRCVKFDKPRIVATEALYSSVDRDLKSLPGHDALHKDFVAYFKATHDLLNLPCGAYPAARMNGVLP